MPTLRQLTLCIPCVLFFPTLLFANEPPSTGYCTKDSTAMAVAKAALSDKGRTNSNSKNARFSARKDGKNWVVIWSDSDYLDGRMRLDIAIENCAILQVTPQYVGR